MSWIADAHTEWHTVNGRWGCPLDCAWSDPGMYYEDEEPDREPSVEQEKAWDAREDDARGPALVDPPF